jgi:hypothetical protein
MKDFEIYDFVTKVFGHIFIYWVNFFFSQIYSQAYHPSRICRDNPGF